ncbi:tol-pal system YbgF family protein [Pedobacter sp. WC2423]|uniref:tetratricopeptide repeat protein n=1 Tax=Pedobacter sp. WC2423 TaxID=3234142 RepID=UPI003467B88F
MKDEIRMAVSLPQELENEVFELSDLACELLEEGKVEEALEKIKLAWEKVPGTKFNTSVSHLVLCTLIPVLNTAGQYNEALNLAKEWIADLETSGYKIYHTMPYILQGETLLFLKDADAAKEAFYQAVKYGAKKRDFSDQPAFYLEVAQKKLNDNQEIMTRFEEEVLSRSVTILRSEIVELSAEVSAPIEELSEQGNDLFEEEKYLECIQVWNEALSLIPEPQNSYSEAFWLEASIGDCYFMRNDFEQSLLHFLNAKGNIGTNAYENPFVMLRLGELFLERDHFNDAKEFLLRAYMLEGEEIFETENEKYFVFLKQNIELTKPG